MAHDKGPRVDVGLQAFRLLCRHLGALIAVPLCAVAWGQVQQLHEQGTLQEWLDWALTSTHSINTVLLGAILVVAVAALLRLYAATPQQPVYLVDFAVHKGRDDWKVARARFIPLSESKGIFTKDDLEFQKKILYRSGLGDETHAPPWLYSEPSHFDYHHARKEFEVCCFSAIKDLLNNTGVKPREIGYVITNCSLFNPTPSLSASIMNHFGMDKGTLNYHLGGMGCSAGVVAIDLARQMLQLHPNSYVLVVSHENLTSNWYPGSDRSMLVPNCIFRSNGAAMLLSNKRSDSWRCKYVLEHLQRTTMPSQEGYNCIFQCEDEKGVRGVRLGKELIGAAGDALKKNLTALGPKVLPLSEKLLFAAWMVRRSLLGAKRVPAHVPDFTQAFDHVCIHTGGRAVLDAMEKQLKLSPWVMEPSRAGLYRFGNTSSTSIWYVLAFIESFRGVSAGQRVWQLGFGSGFKCNSAVWRANRSSNKVHPAWDGFQVDTMRAEFEEADREKAAYLASKAAAGGK